MSDNNKKNISFDHEIREIYQERNAKMLIPKKKNHNYGFLLSYILCMIVSIAASISTTLIVISWFSPLISSTPISKVRPVLVMPENSLAGVVEKLSPTSVVIFAKQSPTVKSPTWQQSYLITKALGHGVVLSSDGWLVSTTEVVNDLTKKYLVAVSDGAMYEVEALIKDPSTAFVYLKISASNLTSAAFARFSEVNIGDTAVVLAATTQSTRRTVLENKITSHDNVGVIKNTTSLIKHSDTVTGFYDLTNPLPKDFVGAPIALLNGKVIGLVASQGTDLRYIYPLETIDIVVDGLFSTQEIKRPVLGVNYVTLGMVTAYSPADLGLPKDGALLVANGNLPAVEAKSPAALGGLKSGDVITYIAGERINGQRSLSDLLQQYRPGTKLTLKVWRNGKESEVEVKLGEIVNKAQVVVEVKK
ncbi:MAG: S1C family serine protease [Patescibacteria group bacterium]